MQEEEPVAIKGAGSFAFLNAPLKAACEKALESFEGADFAGTFLSVPVFGDDYLSLLRGQLNNTGRAFNTAAVRVDRGYLFAVRVLANKDSRAFVIPGNRSESKYEKGENFWWTDWWVDRHYRGTLYFLGDEHLRELTLLVPQLHEEQEANARMISWLTSSDIRLFSTERRVFVASSKIDPTFYGVERSIAAPITMGIHGQDPAGFMSIGAQQLRNYHPGNNYGFISIDDHERYYAVIDWFYKEGVKFRHANNCEFSGLLGKHPSIFPNAPRVVVRENFLPYDPEFPLLGTGSCIEDGGNAGRNSGIMPHFSLGSNLIPCEMPVRLHPEDRPQEQKERGDTLLIGVGHTKIHMDQDQYHYVDGSNIHAFREHLNEDLLARYKARYIRHDAYSSASNVCKGFMYLMYFYTVRVSPDGQAVEMTISDSFLPLGTGRILGDDDYVFSMIFPMGITAKNEDGTEMLITGGMGDYYSVAMSLPTEFILRECRHDVRALDMSNYRYLVMNFKDQGGIEIKKRPRDFQ